MKKLLLTALIIILTILLVFTVVKGWGVGPVNILSISQMREKNAKLDKDIQDTKLMVDKDYEGQLSEQDVNIKDLEEIKKQYEDLVAVNVDENAEPSTQLQRYEMEYLWAQIGNHAKSEGVTLKIDVSESFDPNAEKEQQEGENTEETENKEDTRNTIANTTAKENGIEDPNQSTLEAAVITSTSTGADAAEDVKYDLSFTASGSYVSVADFIYAIENDSSLGFKIEEFQMQAVGLSASENVHGVEAKFKCKGIRIKKVTQTSEQQREAEENEKNNTTNNTTNSTNTTNSSRTSNSTNKSSTSNSSR